MSLCIIYHNPRCSKSREALRILEEKGIQPKVVEYLKNPITEDKILDLIERSDQSPEKFVRKKEQEFSRFSSLNLKDKNQVASILSQNPRLQERPLIDYKKKVLIARPPELISKWISGGG